MLNKAQIHELGFAECPKSYVFRGSKDYNGKQIQEMLGLGAAAPRPQQPQMRPGQPPQQQQPAVSGVSRFLQPVAECEFTLTNIFEQLQKDPWPVANDRRSLRCTGTALCVAIGLIEVFIILFFFFD